MKQPDTDIFSKSHYWQFSFKFYRPKVCVLNQTKLKMNNERKTNEHISSHSLCV